MAGYVKGFDATLSVNGSTIVTIGDITCQQSNTEIEVKTRGSEDIRHEAGMNATTFDFEVFDGTDPEDSNSVNGYTLLLNAKENRTVLPVVFTDASSNAVLSKNMICTKFDAKAPVDGLASADVSLKIAARPVPTSGG